MRFKLIILFAFIASALDAQIGLRPDFFIEQTAPTNTNFEVYSQKSGLPRRASLANLKKPLSPFITDTVDYIPAATGNLTDLASFVWDTTGLLWYIDGEGDAVSFDGGAGGGAVSDGDYGDITVSGTGTVWSIDAGVVGPTELASTAVTPGSYTLTGLTVDADGRLTAASNGTIGSGTNGDMAVWSGANTLTSQTDAKFIYDNNLAYGQGTALRSAYWSNDTTLAPTLIEYSSSLYDADAITGAFGLPTGTTAERPTATLGRIRANSTLGDVEFGNGTLFRSVVESMANTFTPGELGYYNSAGVLTDTTIAAILSMGSGTTGSGVSGRVAYWNGTSSLTGHANFLWDGTDLSVGTTSSSYTLSVGTGGVYITPQSAAVTGVEGAGYWDSDAPKGMWWHDGTAFRATVWGNAPSWASTMVPYSDGAKLVVSDLVYDGTSMAVNSATVETSSSLVVNGNIRSRNLAGTGTGEYYLHHTREDIYVIDTDDGFSIHTNDQTSSRVSFYYGNTKFAHTSLDKGFQQSIFTSLLETGGATVTFQGCDPISGDGGVPTLRGGRSASSNENGGNVNIYGGYNNSANFSGGYGGVPGSTIIWMYSDTAATASASFHKAVQVHPGAVSSAEFGRVQFFKYGDGNRTGTPTYYSAWDTDGKFVEVSPASFGIVGAISTSTDGSGDVTVTHSMGTTPTAVLVTPTGTTPWIVSVHTIGATTFKVRFYDAAGAAVTSTAVTATWLGKT